MVRSWAFEVAQHDQGTNPANRLVRPLLTDRGPVGLLRLAHLPQLVGKLLNAWSKGGPPSFGVSL